MSVPSRGWRFPLRLRPSDFLQDVIDVVQAAVSGMGDAVAAISADAVWEVARPSNEASSVPAGIALSTATPLFAQLVGAAAFAGNEVVLRGTVALRSEAQAVRRFTRRFGVW